MSLRLLPGDGVRGRSYEFIDLESIWGICRSSSDAEVVVRRKFDLAGLSIGRRGSEQWLRTLSLEKHCLPSTSTENALASCFIDTVDGRPRLR